MSQHDFDIANQTFPSFRSDLNDALQAAATVSAGASAPTTPYAYQLWFDTSTNTYKARNAANSAWISLFGTDLTNGGVTFGDNDKAIFGAGSDLQIYHDGSHSYISDQGTGDLKIIADNFEVNNAANTENIIKGISNGAVELYQNGTKRLETTSTGVSVTGGLNTTDFDVVTTTSANYYPQTGGGVDGGADAYLALSGGTSSNGNLKIQARGTYGEIKFYTGGTAGSASTNERMRILSSGGITFNGDTAAANALDDYEEGAFTATLIGATTAGNSPTTTGYYTKVGNTVTIWVQFNAADITGAVGLIRMNGLPFTVTSSVTPLGSIANTRGPNQQASAYFQGGTTGIYQVDYAGSAISWASTGSTYFFVTGTYKT